MLKCGQTNVYLKPECVCSFYNVFEAIYHGFSSCPERDNADIVTQLKCRFKIQKMYIDTSLFFNILLACIACISLYEYKKKNKRKI